MTPEQIKTVAEAIKMEMIPAVNAEIKKTVNGKIDDINKKFDSYVVGDLEWKTTVNTYMTEMMPVKDGLRTVQMLNKFLKWIGFPAVGATIAWFFMK